MKLFLYNTFTKEKQLFKPISSNRVSIYTCGPTVYSHPHIGNFRAFIAADLLRRYLEYLGYEVIQVVNITDVGHMTTDDQAISEGGEDKILLAAQKEKKSPYEIARFYENEFLQLSHLLNMEPAYRYPRATEHIPEMLELIKKLIDKGYAYVVNPVRGEEKEYDKPKRDVIASNIINASNGVNGNVYFEVTKFKKYGSLSGNTLENLMAGARIEVKQEKRNPLDFALWKQDTKHIMQWDSPWGKGFPGWHIECSAMSMKYLGEQIDIHTGGEDNIFPHHESEIAQSETANDRPFVNYWFHTRHLLVDNQKMSKSLGNFYTVKDILDKGYHPMVLRYALLIAHYRQPLNFTMETLDASRSAIQRLLDFKAKLKEIITQDTQQTQNQQAFDKALNDIQSRFETAMNDDLNISEAMGAIFDMIRDLNKLKLSGNMAKKALQLLEKFDGVLGVLSEDEQNLAKEIESLIQERQLARKNKDYKKADEIRDKITGMGIILEDTPQGIRWKKKI